MRSGVRLLHPALTPSHPMQLCSFATLQLYRKPNAPLIYSYIDKDLSSEICQTRLGLDVKGDNNVYIHHCTHPNPTRNLIPNQLIHSPC